MREGSGMDKIMGFYISPVLMCFIMFVSVMHFRNHLCISMSPKIPKEIFANKLYTNKQHYMKVSFT